MPEKVSEDVPVIFHSKSRNTPPPPPEPAPPTAPAISAAIPSFQQLGGILNGVVGNVFEHDNWWLWVFLLIIFVNPELRKKLVGKDK